MLRSLLVGVELDLRSLFSLEPSETHALEAFIASRLFEQGVWESRRVSDGVEHARAVEWSAERVRVCGRIYEIDQTLRSFWLDLERTPSGNVAWALHFDVVADSRGHARNAIDIHDRAEGIDWCVDLAGHAVLRDGALVPVTT